MGPVHKDTRHGRQRYRDQSPWQDDEGSEHSSGSDEDQIFEISASPDVESGRFQLPVWMRESSKTFNRRWIPLPVRQASRAVASWSKGPNPPQIQKISPFFPVVQEAPLRLLDRFFPKKKHRIALLTFFYFCWALIFSLVLHHSATAGDITGYGTPQQIWCGANFWAVGNGCGLNGNNCRPFDNATFAFRCPAKCADTKILNPHAVGDQEVNFRPFVVGGFSEDGANLDPIYRADSFICQAAIHASIISNSEGGCGVVSLIGEQDTFVGVERHGIKSIGFPSAFPKSYTFLLGIPSDCAKDLRWPLLAVTVIFTALLSLFTSSPEIFSGSIFTMLFFHVGLVSDPPNIFDFPSLTSLVIGRFLPAAFVAFVIHVSCVKPQLAGLTAQIEKTVLWIGGAWIGSLNNYTFDRIPISRLTPSDLAQPGAVLALCIIVISIFVIALGQIWYLRLEGRFLQYLAIYALMGAFLLICVAVPSLSLRIHHYVLALLLLPGTGIQTRPSLLYQGLLVGLFINGVARWGFDSILQTPASLIGNGQTNSLLPNITVPIMGVSNITFEWALPPSPYDGLSILVNDVERHRWYYGEGQPTFTWDIAHDDREWYFRFGYMSSSSAADYTKAGVLEVDMTWRTMEPGPSK